MKYNSSFRATYARSCLFDQSPTTFAKSTVHGNEENPNRTQEYPNINGLLRKRDTCPPSLEVENRYIILGEQMVELLHANSLYTLRACRGFVGLRKGPHAYKMAGIGGSDQHLDNAMNMEEAIRPGQLISSTTLISASAAANTAQVCGDPNSKYHRQCSGRAIRISKRRIRASPSWSTIFLVAPIFFLSFCSPVQALGHTGQPLDGITVPTGPWILSTLMACWQTLVFEILGVKYLSLLMFALSLLWPVTKTDPRSSTGLLYSVYLGSFTATAGYGYVALSKRLNRHIYVLGTILLSTAEGLAILFASQDGMQALLTFLPITISVTVFMVANITVVKTIINGCGRGLWQWIQACAAPLLYLIGTFLRGLGERWQHRRYSPGNDLEQGSRQTACPV